MERETASAATDAIIQSGHPRVDFRTEEAKRFTSWMDAHLKPYISEGCELLDIGCSSGKATFKAEELGATVTGIDCSAEAIRLAREIAEDIGSSATFIECDYNRMEFQAATFDVALFPKNIVECTYAEISRLAEQLLRILLPSGILILTMRDGLEEARRRGWKNHSEYDSLTGRFQGSITVPTAGTFSYPTYFWTVGFATFVVGQHLRLQELVEMDERDYLLVFESQKRDDGVGRCARSSPHESFA